MHATPVSNDMVMVMATSRQRDQQPGRFSPHNHDWGDIVGVTMCSLGFLD